jgi:hypothetical protein
MHNIFSGSGGGDSDITVIGKEIYHLATPLDFQKELKWGLNINTN